MQKIAWSQKQVLKDSNIALTLHYYSFLTILFDCLNFLGVSDFFIKICLFFSSFFQQWKGYCTSVQHWKMSFCFFHVRHFNIIFQHQPFLHKIQGECRRRLLLSRWTFWQRFRINRILLCYFTMFIDSDIIISMLKLVYNKTNHFH